MSKNVNQNVKFRQILKQLQNFPTIAQNPHHTALPSKNHFTQHSDILNFFLQNIKKDENTVKEFKEKRIKEIVKNTKNVRIMFYDESRFGLITDIGRRWTIKGVKPIIPYQQKYEYFYLYQATDIKSRDDFSMFMSHLDSVCFNEYLKQLSKRFKNEKIVLIMDNASFHKSKKLKIPKNIKIEYIPPYSPELNSQKKSFDAIKKFKKKVFKTIEELYFHIQKSKSNIYFIIITS